MRTAQPRYATCCVHYSQTSWSTDNARAVEASAADIGSGATGNSHTLLISCCALCPRGEAQAVIGRLDPHWVVDVSSDCVLAPSWTATERAPERAVVRRSVINDVHCDASPTKQLGAMLRKAYDRWLRAVKPRGCGSQEVVVWRRLRCTSATSCFSRTGRPITIRFRVCPFSF